MIKLESNNARMVRRISIFRPANRISAEEFRTRLKLKSMRECLQGRRVKWFCRLKRMEESAWSSKCRTFQG